MNKFTTQMDLTTCGGRISNMMNSHSMVAEMAKWESISIETLGSSGMQLQINLVRKHIEDQLHFLPQKLKF